MAEAWQGHLKLQGLSALPPQKKMFSELKITSVIIIIISSGFFLFIRKKDFVMITTSFKSFMT